jgi:hypothetical protein
VVLQAIAELKRRGLKVTLYPFILMDPPAGQAAYPWRGRITCAPGADGTAAATTAQVAAFFDGTGACAGWCCTTASIWPRRRAASDGFIIGSELRGLTTVRGAGGRLSGGRQAEEPGRRGSGRGRDPATKLGYAADWSEYFGHQPADGGGTPSSISIRCGPIRTSISSASTGIRRSPTGARARTTATSRPASSGRTTRPICARA